jgi:hypothetical protein
MTKLLKFKICLGINNKNDDNNNNNNNNSNNNNNNNNNNTYLLIWGLDSGKVNYRQSYEKKTRHRNTNNTVDPVE